jgi:hypothetical protein
MTLEDFQRNTRGVNNGKNFGPEYMSQIYDAIRERAIIMPEEHDGELGLNYAWKELLKRAALTGNSMKMPSASTNAYDGDMLVAVWAPTVAAISYGECCFFGLCCQLGSLTRSFDQPLTTPKTTLTFKKPSTVSIAWPSCRRTMD